MTVYSNLLNIIFSAYVWPTEGGGLTPETTFMVTPRLYGPKLRVNTKTTNDETTLTLVVHLYIFSYTRNRKKKFFLKCLTFELHTLKIYTLFIRTYKRALMKKNLFYSPTERRNRCPTRAAEMPARTWKSFCIPRRLADSLATLFRCGLSVTSYLRWKKKINIKLRVRADVVKTKKSP